MADQLLTPAEAGQRLRCSAKTVTRMVDRGVLAGVDISLGKSRARIRVPESAINRLIKERAL